MSDYELTVLLAPDLSEKELDKEIKNLQTLLEKAGAKVKSKTDPVKKTMAYEIRKVREAYYVYFELSAEGSNEPLNDKIKTEDKIIRYLLVKK